MAKQAQLHIPTRAPSQDSNQSGPTLSLIIVPIERMKQNENHKLRIYCIIKKYCAKGNINFLGKSFSFQDMGAHKCQRSRSVSSHYKFKKVVWVQMSNKQLTLRCLTAGTMPKVSKISICYNPTHSDEEALPRAY